MGNLSNFRGALTMSQPRINIATVVDEGNA